MASTQSSGKKRRGSVAGAPGPNGAAAASPNGVEPTVLLDHYRQMVHIRLFEEACQRGFRTARSAAISTSTSARKRSPPASSTRSQQTGDKIITAYRDHAHALLLGADPERGHGRALRQGHRSGQGQGRLDAPLRRRERLHAAATASSAGTSRSASAWPTRCLPRHRQHRPALSGRRRDPQRRLPRGGQPGRTLGQATG